MKPRCQLAACSLVLTAGLAAQDWGRKPEKLVVAPVAPVAARVGKSTKAMVRFRVADGFHVNSHKPTSVLLIPTELKITAVPGVKVAAIEYPHGKDFILPIAPTEKLNVYSGEVEVAVPFTAARPGRYVLPAALTYQACDDRSCYPPKTVRFDVPLEVTPR